jgi:hypothetical protein
MLILVLDVTRAWFTFGVAGVFNATLGEASDCWYPGGGEERVYCRGAHCGRRD